MKELIESIFDDDDIIKDADNAYKVVLKELGLSNVMSIKNGKFIINTIPAINTRTTVDIMTKNADKLKQFATEISHIHNFSDSMNKGLFVHFKINRCKYFTISKTDLYDYNIDNIDVIRVIDVDLAIQDDYIYKACEMANKHKAYAVYFDTSFADTPISFIIRALKELRKCKTVKYILFTYSRNVYEFIRLELKSVEQLPELKRELDVIYTNGEKRNIYFVENFTAISSNKDVYKFEPYKDSYNVKILKISADKDIKRQLK